MGELRNRIELIRGLCPHLEYIHKSELIDLNVQFRGMCPRSISERGLRGHNPRWNQYLGKYSFTL